LQALRREVRREFLAESRKQKAAKLLRQIPCIGPIRAGLLIALMQTPHRFRSKRQLWTYSGLGIETHDSGFVLAHNPEPISPTQFTPS
jgi:transposase